MKKPNSKQLNGASRMTLYTTKQGFKEKARKSKRKNEEDGENQSRLAWKHFSSVPNQLLKNFNSFATSTEWRANLHQVSFVGDRKTTFSHFHYVCVCSCIPARDNTKALKGMLSYLAHEVKEFRDRKCLFSRRFIAKSRKYIFVFSSIRLRATFERHSGHKEFKSRRHDE